MQIYGEKKSMSTKIFAPLRKVDIEKQTVVGVVAAEEPDRAGEVMDYESTKPFFEAWSDSVLKLDLREEPWRSP